MSDTINKIKNNVRGKNDSTPSISEKEMQKLGIYLKSLREDLGLTLRTAAKLSSISFAHLSKIERGTVFHTVGIDILMKLSRVYNIPLSYILEESHLVKSSGANLPEFAQYLRHKYNLPAQAIRDLETAKEVVERKYRRKNDPQLNLFE